jgi:hypothetical protein
LGIHRIKRRGHNEQKNIVNLKIAVRLSDAGYLQADAKYYWINKVDSEHPEGNYLIYTKELIDGYSNDPKISIVCAAPTAGELVEILPASYKKGSHSYEITIEKHLKEWAVIYTDRSTSLIGHNEFHSDLCTALAQMYLVLEKNKIIERNKKGTTETIQRSMC